MFETLVQKIIAGIIIITTAIGGLFVPAPLPPQIEETKLLELQEEVDLIKVQVQVERERLEKLLEQQTIFGATRFVAGERYRLAGSGISLTATSVAFQSFQTLDGRELAMANFGDTGWATLEPGTSKKEFISFTGVSQDASNDEATLTGVTRGLDFIYPYTASSTLAQTHSGGALAIISNPPQLYNQMAAKDNDESITGTWTFSSTSIPTLDSYLAPTDNAEFASKKYADDLAIAGAPDASLTVKGIVEIATKSDLSSSAAASSSDTSAYLIVPTSYFTTSSSATTSIPVTDASGKLSQGFIDLTGDFVWTGEHTFSAATTLATTTLATTTISNTLSVTGTSTFTGTTTFSAIPTLPASDPTLDNQAGRKSYIDAGDFSTTTSGGRALNTNYQNGSTWRFVSLSVQCNIAGTNQTCYTTFKIGVATSSYTTLLKIGSTSDGSTAGYTWPIPAGSIIVPPDYYYIASTSGAVTASLINWTEAY